jgi:hypothetical protein
MTQTRMTPKRMDELRAMIQEAKAPDEEFPNAEITGTISMDVEELELILTELREVTRERDESRAANSLCRGCNESLVWQGGIFRCTDCEAEFHKHCLKKHCVDDLEEARKERDQAIRERDEAKADAEHERVRLASAGVAALGYLNPGEVKPDDYDHSASLDDVFRLRAELNSYRDRYTKLWNAAFRVNFLSGRDGENSKEAKSALIDLACVLQADDEAEKEMVKS